MNSTLKLDAKSNDWGVFYDIKLLRHSCYLLLKIIRMDIVLTQSTIWSLLDYLEVIPKQGN